MKRQEVILADALQHEKGCGRGAAVRDEMRPARRYGVGLARREAHFLLRLAQEYAQRAAQYIKRVGDIVVVVPRHFLRRRELELGDAESGPRGVLGTALDLVERACVLERFHAAILPRWRRA